MAEIEELIHEAKELKLEGYCMLELFSMDEIRKIYNGIGPSWLPEDLRDLCTKWGSLLEPAALIHDVQYELGGSRKEFKNANDSFLNNCITIINRKYPAWDPRRWLWHCRSRRWTKWCSLFGWTAFHFQVYHTEES